MAFSINAGNTTLRLVSGSHVEGNLDLLYDVKVPRGRYGLASVEGNEESVYEARSRGGLVFNIVVTDSRPLWKVVQEHLNIINTNFDLTDPLEADEIDGIYETSWYNHDREITVRLQWSIGTLTSIARAEYSSYRLWWDGKDLMCAISSFDHRFSYPGSGLIKQMLIAGNDMNLESVLESNPRMHYSIDSLLLKDTPISYSKEDLSGEKYV